METVHERLTLIGRHVDHALAALDADAGASPVLRAVVRELKRKSEKASTMVKDGSERVIRDAVVEAEQAADSAKVAADADPALLPQTRQAVEDAHLAFCLLKHELAR